MWGALFIFNALASQGLNASLMWPGRSICSMAVEIGAGSRDRAGIRGWASVVVGGA